MNSITIKWHFSVNTAFIVLDLSELETLLDRRKDLSSGRLLIESDR
jgi:hypothetical protein